MVVQHNLTAMNSNRMLNVTTKSQAKSTEKLSSGYRINRAADDAAGLSISEKMRKQIRGLSQASDNAQDGISAVQTAEGALAEVHDMLQRMNELAIKASNGTQSTDDKKYIQDEIDQLVTEIDRVSETTKFNEIYLLKGDNTKGNNYKTSDGTDLKGQTLDNVTSALNDVNSATIKNDGTFSAKAATDEFVAAGIEAVGTDTTFTALAISTAADRDSTDANTKAVAKGESYIKYTLQTDGLLGDDITEIRLYADSAATVAAADKSDSVMTLTYSQLDTFKNLVESDIRNSDGGDKIKSITMDDNFEKIQIELFADAKKDALGFDLQVGADTTTANKIGVDIKSMSASTLGINGLRIDGATNDRADAAVNKIAAAIQKVSTQRSALGAAQNRLEHTISNLDNIVENTTSAESAIRDTDMAEEMVKYSNNNILAQAGQSMLAQANQSNQGVLSLLG